MNEKEMQDLTRSRFLERYLLAPETMTWGKEEIWVAESPCNRLVEYVRPEIMRIYTRAWQQKEKNSGEHENLQGGFGQDIAMNKI